MINSEQIRSKKRSGSANRLKQRSKATIVGVSFIFCATGTALGDETTETLVLSVENDVFTGSDNQYTNGVSITWSSDELVRYDKRAPIRKWASIFQFLPGFDPNQSDSFVSLSLIHEMNTPSDITIPDPPLDDQPYSGVLLFDTSLYSKTERWNQAWSVRVGAVGPITQADHLQTSYHEWIGADEPLGWDTQLPNEVIVNLGYTAGYTDWYLETPSGLEWRVSPVVNAELGTYATAVGGGLFLEAGNGLENTLGTASLGQGLGSIVGIGSKPTDEWKVSAYAGIGGYAVGHYLPLDGTVFRDSRSVDADPYLAFGSLGVTARYKKLVASFGLTFGATPFEDEDDDIDYGALSIGWHF
ncbi:MAG: lipid A deacylase LpxR family protein [Pseudomonadota bacterium]